MVKINMFSFYTLCSYICVEIKHYVKIERSRGAVKSSPVLWEKNRPLCFGWEQSKEFPPISKSGAHHFPSLKSRLHFVSFFFFFISFSLFISSYFINCYGPSPADGHYSCLSLAFKVFFLRRPFLPPYVTHSDAGRLRTFLPALNLSLHCIPQRYIKFS